MTNDALEKWIEEKAKLSMFAGTQLFIKVYELRELFKGKVLVDAEKLELIRDILMPYEGFSDAEQAAFDHIENAVESRYASPSTSASCISGRGRGVYQCGCALCTTSAGEPKAVDLRYTSDGALAECPCCESLDVGGAHSTVHCYSCGLTITKEGPLANAIAAWNTRKPTSAGEQR